MISTWTKFSSIIGVHDLDGSFAILYLLSLISIVLLIFHVSIYRHWSKQGVKGPAPWPIIGNSLSSMFESPLDKLSRDWNKFGPVHGLYRGIVPHLIVGDPGMLKDVLVRDWHIFADRRGGCIDGNPITDNFLVSLSGDGWKRMRSAMSPTFTSGKMKSMYHIMNDCSQSMVQFIGSKLESNGLNNSKGTELDLRRLSSCLSMDVIAKCCFATDTNSFNDPNQIFVTFAKKFFDVSITRRLLSVILPNFVRGLVGFSINPMECIEPLAEITKKILNQRSKDGHFDKSLQPSAEKSDYLQLLIESSNQEATTSKFKPLTVDEIISNSVLFFAVGFDTTASLITATCYLLSCNQDVQTKLYNELKNTKGENEKFEYETIMNLKYLDAVISESLRLLPPAPIIERRVLEDYTFKKNGIKVPKGGIVTLPIYNIQMDEKYWINPKKFDPSRFLPENKSSIVPYSYIPFGGGPRSCIGMRFALIVTKLTIANLISNYQLIETINTRINMNDLASTVDAVLFSPKNVIIGVMKRE